MTKQVWSQKDRETPMAQARRTIMQAEAAVSALWGIYDAELDRLRHHPPALCARTLEPLTAALGAARTLLQAYDYFLARCAETGMAVERAHALWEEYSSPAFEAELVEAESYGPNAMQMIDEQMLSHLGLPPHDADGSEMS